MKKTDKMKKEQVLAIPDMLETMSIGEVAREFGVTWQCIWYWVGKLRERGVEVKTRRKGKRALLDQ